jgi:hypothetical protein
MKFEHKEAPVVTFDEPELTIYEIAEAITGCPAELLVGFAFAESSNGRNLNHSNPSDRGWFGIHETKSYHEERARLYGEYNADCPLDSAILTGKLFMTNLKLLGNVNDAICAHNQGPTGVKRDGRREWYLQRVLHPVII